MPEFDPVMMAVFPFSDMVSVLPMAVFAHAA
jgi:hypothetical protein